MIVRKLRMVIKNQLYHYLTVLPIILFFAIFLLAAVDSLVLVNRVNNISRSSLQALQTDLILQSSRTTSDKNIRPRGLVVPFSLAVFPQRQVITEVKKISYVSRYATTLTLWQMTPKGTITFVGVDPGQAAIGANKARKLIYRGRFLSGSHGDEIVLERHFSKLFGYHLHQRFKLGDKQLKIVGIIDFKNSSNLNNASAYIPYYTAKAAAGLDKNVVNQVFLHLNRATDIAKIKPLLERKLPALKIISQDSLLKNLSGLNALVYKFGRYFLAAVFIVTGAAVAIGWRFYLADFRGQYQILRIIGWNRAHLRRWQALELAVIVVFASLIVVGGYFISSGFISHQLSSQINIVGKIKL